MIIYHSKLDLKKWCINWDYLSYQEGLISKSDFLKTVEENKDHEKRGYWKERWKSWRNEKYGLSNDVVSNVGSTDLINTDPYRSNWAQNRNDQIGKNSGKNTSVALI